MFRLQDIQFEHPQRIPQLRFVFLSALLSRISPPRAILRLLAVSPSLALSISRANAGFYYTSFYSYQDTIYVGKLGNAYFSGGEVAGETDFLYGFGTAWLSETALTLRGCGGGIAAWKGANTTFENKYGVYVVNSWVKKENETATGVGKCALGRPWVSFSNFPLQNEREQERGNANGSRDRT